MSSDQQLQRFSTLILHLVETGLINIYVTFLQSHVARVIYM